MPVGTNSALDVRGTNDELLVSFDEFGIVEIRDPRLLEAVPCGQINGTCTAPSNYYCQEGVNGNCPGGAKNHSCTAGVNGLCKTNNSCDLAKPSYLQSDAANVLCN